MNRAQHVLKLLLALWLVASVLVAGALVQLPELHAKLHCEGTSVCSSQDDHGHDHHGPEHPNEHQCLAELLALGCVDAPASVEFVPVQFVALSEAALFEDTHTASPYSSAAIPGRAPPTC